MVLLQCLLVGFRETDAELFVLIINISLQALCSKVEPATATVQRTSSVPLPKVALPQEP